MSEQASLAAFEAFAAAERGKALKYATALVGSEAAQDIVQEGLVVVWKKWDTLVNPAAYLRRTCRLLAFGEYEDRNRGPALLAQLPDRPCLNDLDDDQDELTEGAALWKLSAELLAQEWSSPHAPRIAIGLATGRFTRTEIAEAFQLPLSEVHGAARELRRYFKARNDSSEPAAEMCAYTPHGLVMKAMRRLSRRERQVMALATLGLKPQSIAPLIGITGGSARTTLCHARKAVADTIGLFTEGEGDPDVVDHFVRGTLDPIELLHMLPSFPWRAEALQLAAMPKGERFQVGTTKRRWARFLGPEELIPSYLTEISTVIVVAREGMEASRPVVAYGSVRWIHPNARFISVREYITGSSAYHRLQAADSPYEVPDGFSARYPAVETSASFCPVPSWPAKPPRYLVSTGPTNDRFRFEPTTLRAMAFLAEGASQTVTEAWGLSLAA